MGNIILLEQEEDIRMAAVIVARNRDIILKAYKDYSAYKDNMHSDDIVISSDIDESKKYNLIYIKKPYTAGELMELIKREQK